MEHVAARPDVRAPARGRFRDGGLLVLVLAAYVGAAKLGIELPVGEGVITPVWAPSGIALGALLVLGLRLWPAVALGAFVANATSGAPIAVAAGIAVGNTLEAVVGALLVRKLAPDIRLDRVRSVLALVVGGAVVSTAISATNGVTILTLAGETDEPYASAWLLWWFGDAVGDLMIAPLVLVLFAARRARPTRAQLVEGAALLAAVTAASVVVFLAGAWRYPYVIFPLLFWGALRFRQLGAATTSFVVGAIGTWGAVEGTIPFAGVDATARVQIAQALFVLVAVSVLVVGATLSEREAGRVALAETASRLSEAQAVAHVGSWRWDIRRDLVTWSDELYRVFGLAPQSQAVSYGSYLDRLHPEDRELVDGEVRRALADRRPFAFEHRIVRPDGTERVVASRGRVVLEGGEPVAMLGTAQDITDRRHAERLREDMLAAVSHELRTPLTSVLGFALTLERRRAELSDHDVDEAIRQLVRAARRLDVLLGDLLDVERARRGVIDVRRSKTDVRALVERVVAAAALDGRSVEIRGERVLANVDAPKLERIVENLVANAVKHTPPKSSIEVTLAARGSELLLAVEDDGPGIAPAFREEIFETFNRGPSMLSLTPGAGIGLSLVARFAAVQGGRAWVDDRPGGGASFRVSLPDAVVEQAGVGVPT